MTSRTPQSKRMTREEYREVYLRSDHWRETRLGALERAEHRCQVCNSAKFLNVHHRTYERVGEERPADLTVLCRMCHKLFHERRKVQPEPRLTKAQRKAQRKKAKPERQQIADEARASAKQRAKEARHLKPELRAQVMTDRQRAAASMERRNAEERRRRKQEREAQAKADFEAGREQDAPPWDKHDRRAQQARRERAA